MCGRVCFELDKKRIKIVAGMWRRLYKEKKLDDIIFPHLKGKTDQKSLLTFAAVANKCLLRSHKDRPSMVEIVKKLKIALDHQQKFHDQHIPNDAMMPMSADISGENIVPSFPYKRPPLSFTDMSPPSSFTDQTPAVGENMNHTNCVGPGYLTYNAPSISDLAINQADSFVMNSYVLKSNDYLKYGLSSSRVERYNDSITGADQASGDGEFNKEDYVGRSFVGKNFREVNPSAYYVEKDD